MLIATVKLTTDSMCCDHYGGLINQLTRHPKYRMASFLVQADQEQKIISNYNKAKHPLLLGFKLV